MIKQLLSDTMPPSLDRLQTFLNNLGSSQWEPQQWAKARVAVMKAVSRHREDVVSVVSEQVVKDIEGHRDQILMVLREKNIHVLPGGTLETYLPHYQGDEYELDDTAKRKAVLAELDEIAGLSEEELSSRYRELYNIVRRLPAKPEVDVETVLRNHLGDYIHELQKIVVRNPGWDADQIQAQINNSDTSHAAVFSIRAFTRGDNNSKFNATVEITELLGQGKRWTEVNEHTIAGMLEFAIHSNGPTIEDTV